jgi:uncharacterized membrane protein
MPIFSVILPSAGVRRARLHCARLHYAGLIAGGLMAAGPAAHATTYTYQPIVAAGGNGTYPLGLNNAGEVLGYYYDSNYASHPFTYQNGTMTPVTFKEGVDGIRVAGINDKGDICGSYADKNDVEHGFIYTAQGKLITLDVPGGTDTFINAINDRSADEATGSAYVNGYSVAFVYSKGTYTIFTPQQQYVYFTPQAINLKGSVVGYQSTQFGSETGFTYINGVFTLLTLPDTYFTAAFGINVHNVAVGQLANSLRQEYGYFYTSAGKEKILGPKGITDSWSAGINDSSVVTGVSYPSSGNYSSSVGYTYDKGVYSTLSFGGYSNFSGNYINASGQVVGEYVDENGLAQVFLATPVQ